MSEVQSLINIGGVVRPVSELTLPEDTRFQGAWVLDGDVVTVDPVRALELQRESAEMSRAEFAIAAWQAGLVSEADAEDWAGGSSVPASILAIINGWPEEQMNPAQKLEARIEARTTPIIRRNSRMIEMLRVGMDQTHEFVDSLFGIEV